MARRMLLAYYVNCEHVYSQGHHAYKSGMAEPGPNILKECGAALRQ
jgi:hypothetical protein